MLLKGFLEPFFDCVDYQFLVNVQIRITKFLVMQEKNTEKLVNFSDRFKKLMDESGLTQTAAAKIFGVSQGAIFDYREGRSEPKSWPLLRMAKYFGVSVEWLMTGESDNKEDSATQVWRDRALDAERKLEIARDALKGALKKILK